MRKLGVSVIVLMGLFAVPVCAEQLVSLNKGPYVLVFETKDKMD